MKILLMTVTVLGLAGISDVAVAQTANAFLNGHKADFVVSPPPAGGSLAQDMVGSNKTDVIARISGATPSVINISKAGVAEPVKP